VLFGDFNGLCKKEASACKISQYRMAHLTEFAWSKDASVRIGPNDFE
jgi:hypothetical protein